MMPMFVLETSISDDNNYIEYLPLITSDCLYGPQSTDRHGVILGLRHRQDLSQGSRRFLLQNLSQ